MEISKKFRPRKGDLPVKELFDKACKLVQEDLKNGVHTDIVFKFTCEHCGERCAFEMANTLYGFGECCSCGRETKVEYGGFSTISKF